MDRHFIGYTIVDMNEKLIRLELQATLKGTFCLPIHLLFAVYFGGSQSKRIESESNFNWQSIQSNQSNQSILIDDRSTLIDVQSTSIIVRSTSIW